MRSRFIDGWPGYLITDDGRVWSEHIGRFKKLVKLGRKKDRVMVTLSCKGKKSLKQVSRMVTEYFVPNPENKLEVNHKDGYPGNNHYLNLEWVTGQENSDHAWDNDLFPYGENKTGTTKLSNATIVEIRKRLSNGEIGNRLAKEYRVTRGHIYNIKNGKARRRG